MRDVPRPEPGPDQVLVAVRAADINPSEAAMQAGRVREFFPLTFPKAGPTALRVRRLDLFAEPAG
jgi:NADPH:quinone reductase-like Zn-dependent oxidoreductase